MQGSAEDRLDLVADVLEDEAALAADGRLHLGEVLVEIAHHFPRLGPLHPRREVAEVGEEHGHLLQLAVEARPPGQDLVAHLAGDVLAEGVPDDLALAQPLEHAVEALAHGADLVIGLHGDAAVQLAAAHRGHLALEASEGIGHAARREDRQPGGGHDPHAHDEGDDQPQLADEMEGCGGIDARERQGARVGDGAQDGERDDADQQEDDEEPHPDREADGAGNPADVAPREEVRHGPPPLMLRHEEDEGGGHAARHPRDAEHRSPCPLGREEARDHGPEHAPDDTRRDPGDKAHHREHGRKHERPLLRQPGLGFRQVGDDCLHLDEWGYPLAHPHPGHGNEGGEAHHEIADLPQSEIPRRARRGKIDDPEIEEGQEGADKVADDQDPRYSPPESVHFGHRTILARGVSPTPAITMPAPRGGRPSPPSSPAPGAASLRPEAPAAILLAGKFPTQRTMTTKRSP